MPDLTGLGMRQAVHWAHAVGLDVRVEGHGMVVSQSPKPGEPYNEQPFYDVGDFLVRINTKYPLGAPWRSHYDTTRAPEPLVADVKSADRAARPTYNNEYRATGE